MLIFKNTILEKKVLVSKKVLYSIRLLSLTILRLKMWSFKEVFAKKICQFWPLPYIYGENTVFSQRADYLVLTDGGLGHEKNVDLRLS